MYGREQAKGVPAADEYRLRRLRGRTRVRGRMKGVQREAHRLEALAGDLGIGVPAGKRVRDEQDAAHSDEQLADGCLRMIQVPAPEDFRAADQERPHPRLRPPHVITPS